jgi:hypothetical protein
MVTMFTLNLKDPAQKPHAILRPLSGENNWKSLSHKVHVLSELIIYDFVYFTDLRCTFVIQNLLLSMDSQITS